MKRDYNIKYRGRLPVVLELYPLGVTPEEIALGLKVSVATIVQQVDKLKEKEKFSKRQTRDPKNRFPVLLRRYAQLKLVEFPKNVKLNGQRIHILEIALDVSRIEGYIQGLDETFMRLSEPECAPEHLPYLRLLQAVYATTERARYNVSAPLSRASDVWKAFLKRVAIGERVPASYEDLCAEMLGNFATAGRAKVMPIWEKPFNDAALVNAEIDKLSTLEQEVLRSIFGITVPLLSPDEIADARGVTRTRIYQIVNDGLNKFRDANERNLITQLVTPVGVSYREWRRTSRILEETIQHAARQAREEELVRESTLSPAMLELYLKPIEVLLLSARAFNCLGELRIARIGDLIQRTRKQLLETKNFGRLSLREIEGELTRNSLRLDTILTAEQRKQFEDAKAELLSRKQ